MSEERKPVRRERELTWEAVRQRNSVERIKEEKLPFDLIDELPRLAETPYEAVDEADILRLQWWGLYHDKPKIGEFMMRVKIAGGIVTPAQLKAIAEISRDFGEGSGEITTRQCIQIHHLHLPAIPEVFARLKAAGLTTSGACGDILRNITGCPVAGISQEELFDPRPAMQQLVDFFYGNRDYSDLPRKHKWTMACCHYHCNAPEMHDVGLIGAVQDGVQGFAITVGGGLSTVPRIAKSFGVFAAESELLEVMRGILDEWSNDLNYRRSRGKARFKFMIDDHGPDAVRERVEARLGRKLTPLKELPQPIGRTDHMGVHPQKQAGLHYVGVPVFPGIFPVDKMLAVAELAAEYGDDIRFTREQNFIITGVPTAKVDALVAALAELGYRLDGNAVRHHSIGCTGNPLCNFAVGDTKPRLVRLVDHLEARFGERIAHLRIHLDGCPHACGQHWVGDIGIQGTTLTTADGKVPAYDILLRGALGPGAAIAKAVGRRVPSDDLDLHVERLIAAYLDWRKAEESIQSFFAERSDDELKAIMQGEAAALAG
ncbi:MAG TPA: nitrite/sulfite reductase [Limnochordia bacterium]|nr:nitrite/sulfite reductase [Limnochordia bacterium]